MNVYRDISLSRWLVAAILVATAQFAIAPRPAQARCGDYVILGGHGAHHPPMATDHVGYKGPMYESIMYATRRDDKAVWQPHAAPVPTRPVSTHPDLTHADPTQNGPLHGGHCSGPMCSNDGPRPLGGPTAPIETDVQQWGLIAVQWLGATVVPQFARFAADATLARIVANSVYRPPR